MQTLTEKIIEYVTTAQMNTVAAYILAAVFIKTILHPPSRGLKNFLISLTTAWTLGFIVYRVLVNDVGLPPDTSTLICIPVGIISKELFAMYLSSDLENFMKWLTNLIKTSCEAIVKILIGRLK